MDLAPNLGLPYIMAAQSQKHITHNEAIRALDAIVQLSVLDRSLSAPPGSPAEGARYIVGASPTGAWSGHAGEITAWQDGAWMFYPPREGWIAWVSDEDVAVVWSGSAWTALTTGEGGGGGGGEGDFSTLGINATADTTNRLAVSADATLLNHDGDDHRLKINKAAAGDTASLLYQSAFSGRAELGLAGDDDFHFKVSADGSTWKEAILINRSTGSVSFPFTSIGGGGGREVLTANRTYYVRTAGSDSNNGLSSGAAFLTIGKAIGVCKTIDFNGHTVTVDIGSGTFSGQVIPGVNVGQASAADLVLSGAGAGSTTVTYDGLYEGTIAASGFGVKLKLQSMTVRGTGAGGSGIAITAYNGAEVVIGADVTIGQTGYAGLIAAFQGTINNAVGVTLTFTADAAYPFIAQDSGVLNFNTFTVELGTRTVTATARATTLGEIVLNSVTWSGSVTGQKYRVEYNGVLFAYGNAANILGSGTTVANGGQVG